MWPFKKRLKIAKKIPRILVIKDPKFLEEFYRLYDAVKAPGSTKLAEYKFWLFVGTIYPETVNGNWIADVKCIFYPSIVERL